MNSLVAFELKNSNWNVCFFLLLFLSTLLFASNEMGKCSAHQNM